MAFRNAARVMQETGCQAVKLEGGARMAETIHYLTQRGIPVMAHIGLTPQRIQIFGGFKTQGRTEAEWPAIEADAARGRRGGRLRGGAGRHGRALGGQDHRAKSPSPPSASAPRPQCDGQILVMEDMLGLNPAPPKFVRQYASMGAGHRGGGEGLCGRGPRPHLPGQGKRLQHEESGLISSPVYGSRPSAKAPVELSQAELAPKGAGLADDLQVALIPCKG